MSSSSLNTDKKEYNFSNNNDAYSGRGYANKSQHYSSNAFNDKEKVIFNANTNYSKKNVNEGYSEKESTFTKPFQRSSNNVPNVEFKKSEYNNHNQDNANTDSNFNQNFNNNNYQKGRFKTQNPNYNRGGDLNKQQGRKNEGGYEDLKKPVFINSKKESKDHGEGDLERENTEVDLPSGIKKKNPITDFLKVPENKIEEVIHSEQKKQTEKLILNAQKSFNSPTLQQEETPQQLNNVSMHMNVNKSPNKNNKNNYLQNPNIKTPQQGGISSQNASPNRPKGNVGNINIQQQQILSPTYPNNETPFNPLNTKINSQQQIYTGQDNVTGFYNNTQMMTNTNYNPYQQQQQQQFLMNQSKGGFNNQQQQSMQQMNRTGNMQTGFYQQGGQVGGVGQVGQVGGVIQKNQNIQNNMNIMQQQTNMNNLQNYYTNLNTNKVPTNQINPMNPHQVQNYNFNNYNIQTMNNLQGLYPQNQQTQQPMYKSSMLTSYYGAQNLTGNMQTQYPTMSNNPTPQGQQGQIGGYSQYFQQPQIEEAPQQDFDVKEFSDKLNLNAKVFVPKKKSSVTI
jgi:hypothetical protein